MGRILDVYLHEQLSGQLTQGDDGRLSFAYHRDYLAQNNAAISVAMPLQEQGFSDAIVRAFFSGLLPDERARDKLASVLGVSRENAFGLLEVIGGECAGALSLLPEGVPPVPTDSDSIEPLDEQALGQILTRLRQRPLLGGEQGVRLSLAGAQDKLAVCVVDDHVALPRDGRPTTHILKPFIEGLEGTVENELFCMMLASRVGLHAPSVSHGQAAGFQYLLVTRYDRQTQSDGSIVRRHQEDFCQALSVAPELKYEEEGGPGVSQVESLIGKVTRRPAAERLAFHRMLIFHYLIGNADAHAKNYALLYQHRSPDLAPVYDVVCTEVYPQLNKKLAMQVGGRSLPDTLHRAHWLSLVPDTKAAQRLLLKEIATLTADVQQQADALLHELKDSAAYHPVLKAIRRVIDTRARMLDKLH